MNKDDRKYNDVQTNPKNEWEESITEEEAVKLFEQKKFLEGKVDKSYKLFISTNIFFIALLLLAVALACYLYFSKVS